MELMDEIDTIETTVYTSARAETCTRKDADMKNSVVVSTGRSKLHLYYAARAAQKAGLLHSMITAVYVKNKWVPIVRFLAKTTNKNFFNRLLFCRDNQINDHKVVSMPTVTLASKLRTLISQRGVSDDFRFWLERVESIYYGKRTNKYIRPGVKLIHSRSGYSRAIIPYARKTGAKVLLSQSAAHPDFVMRVMEEEYDMWNVPVKNRTYVGPREEMKWDISQAEYIITNSDYVAQSIRENTQNHKKIFVVHTGVDVNMFEPKQKTSSDRFRVLYVGNLSTYKGVGYLIKAFKKLNLPAAELMLVGKKPEDCPSIVDEYKEFFTYIPAVPYSDVPATFADANVFVFPSIVEGPSRVVGEAMATGLPCIVTPSIPNCRHIVEDGVDGFVVPAKNIEALAEKILYLYQNRDLCFEMGRKARQKAVNSLTWGHYQKNLLGVYTQILNDEEQ